MRSSVSIALFFLLSGFFLFALLAAIDGKHRPSDEEGGAAGKKGYRGKALAVAGACLVAVVCIIIFLTPVRLPDWLPGNHNDDDGKTTTTVGVTTTTVGSGDATTVGVTTTTPRATTSTLRVTTTTTEARQ